jgi:hypothetical protein
MVRISYAGRAYELTEAQLGVALKLTDAEIKHLLAQQLDIAEGVFDGYAVDRNANGDLVVRPELRPDALLK